MRIAYGSRNDGVRGWGLIALAAVFDVAGELAQGAGAHHRALGANGRGHRGGSGARPRAEPASDFTGAYQLTPTSASTPGYKPVTEKSTPAEMAAAVNAVAGAEARNYFSTNFVWVLIAGFLVIFMQAGFALVETGLCRAKNASHTMSMNFAVYGLGMFGFFVLGFGLMCGGYNGTMIGGPGPLGGLPTLNSMFTVGSSIQGDSGWGLFGMEGFFLTGDAYDGSVVVMFLFMMAFMDTTATIVTGACCERWSYKSFFIYSILVGGFIYPIFGCWVWGGGWLAQLGYRLGIGHGAVDYAGSGVVPPAGRRAGGRDRAGSSGRASASTPRGQASSPILAHHIPMVQLGTFILAVRLVRLQRRLLAGRHRRPHRHGRRQHHDRRHVGDDLRCALHVVRRRQARPLDDVQQHARGPGRDHLPVRLRQPGRRVHHRSESPACWSSSERVLLRQDQASTTRSAPPAFTGRAACSA
jgi:hypothetical protein